MSGPTPAAAAQAANQAGLETDYKVLTISEVGVLFEGYTERTQQRDAEYQPNAMLLKAVEYSARFSTNKNKDTLQKIRE